MKSISIILLLLIVCQLTVCTMLQTSALNTRRRKHKRNSNNNTVFVAKNKWGSLLLGLLSGVTSVNHVDQLNKCLPNTWRVKKVKPFRLRRTPESRQLKRFLDITSKAITVICGFKHQIKQLFHKRLHLRNSKLFLQLNSSQWRWRKFRNVVKNFQKTANTLQKFSKKHKKFNKKNFKKLGATIRRTVDKLRKFFLMIKAQIEKFLNPTFVQKVTSKVIPCLKNLKSIGAQISAVAHGIVQKITTIYSRGFAGLAQVFIDLLCKFKEFRAAAHQLMYGFGEKNESRKFFYFGSFVGQLLKIIGKARFLRMGLFLMNY